MKAVSQERAIPHKLERGEDSLYDYVVGKRKAGGGCCNLDLSTE